MRCFKILSFATVAAVGACGQDKPLDSYAQTLQAMDETACAGESSGGLKTDFAADGTWDPFGTYGRGPIGQFVTAGDVSCSGLPGAEPSGYPPQCPAGSLTHVRGLTLIDRMTSSNPNANTWLTIAINANWDRIGAGPLWGRFSAEIDGGGAWEGTFVGKRTYEPTGCDGAPCYIESIRGVGCGEGGAVDGMKFRAREVIELSSAHPIAFVSTLSGEYW